MRQSRSDETCVPLSAQKHGDDAKASTHEHVCLSHIGSIHFTERHPLIRATLKDYKAMKVSEEVHILSPGDSCTGVVEMEVTCKVCFPMDKRIPLINGALTTGCNGTFATGPGFGVEVQVYVFNEKIRKQDSAIRVVAHVVSFLAHIDKQLYFTMTKRRSFHENSIGSY